MKKNEKNLEKKDRKGFFGDGSVFVAAIILVALIIFSMSVVATQPQSFDPKDDYLLVWPLQSEEKTKVFDAQTPAPNEPSLPTQDNETAKKEPQTLIESILETTLPSPKSNASQAAITQKALTDSRTAAAEITASPSQPLIFVQPFFGLQSFEETNTFFENSASVETIIIQPQNDLFVAQSQNNENRESLQVISSDIEPVVAQDSIVISINEEEKKAELMEGETVIETSQGIIIESGKIFVQTNNSRQALDISPSKAQELANQNGFFGSNGEIVLENDQVHYVFSSKQSGKILGLFDTQFEQKIKIDISSGFVVVDKPIWAILVFG